MLSFLNLHKIINAIVLKADKIIYIFLCKPHSYCHRARGLFPWQCTHNFTASTNYIINNWRRKLWKMSLPDTSSNDIPFLVWSRDVSVYIAVLWWNDGDLSFLVRLADPYSPHHWKIYQGCFLLWKFVWRPCWKWGNGTTIERLNYPFLGTYLTVFLSLSHTYVFSLKGIDLKMKIQMLYNQLHVTFFFFCGKYNVFCIYIYIISLQMSFV